MTVIETKDLLHGVGQKCEFIWQSESAHSIKNTNDPNQAEMEVIRSTNLKSVKIITSLGKSLVCTPFSACHGHLHWSTAQAYDRARLFLRHCELPKYVLDVKSKPSGSSTFPLF
jgi:hypothetical protein